MEQRSASEPTSATGGDATTTPADHRININDDADTLNKPSAAATSGGSTAYKAAPTFASTNPSTATPHPMPPPSSYGQPRPTMKVYEVQGMVQPGQVVYVTGAVPPAMIATPDFCPFGGTHQWVSVLNPFALCMSILFFPFGLIWCLCLYRLTCTKCHFTMM